MSSWTRIIPPSAGLSYLGAQPSSDAPSGQPSGVMIADQHDGLVAGAHAPGDREVLGARQRWIRREHGGARPLDQAWPHPPDQDQRRVAADVADLEELPDHHHL